MQHEADLQKILEGDFDAALGKVVASLKEEGFGVLTEIDVKETMRAKLGVDLARYRILGACNPPIAYRALQSEPDAGLMMPCNVIVYEADGKTTVKAIDPLATLAAGSAALQPIAREVREKLTKVIARLT
ncbi:MAG: DUF302 domain-containing protein [Kofleriaceae bacterium]